MLAAARGLAAREHQVLIAACGGSRLDAAARAAGVETVSIDGRSMAAAGAWDLRRVLREKFVEVAVVGSERDQLIVSSAMRLAERGAVLRRVPSFERLDVQRSGKLAVRIASAGLLFTTERELKEAPAVGWPIPPAVVPLGVDAARYDAVSPAGRHRLESPHEGLLMACAYDPTGRNRIATVFRTLALLAPRHAHMHVVVFGPGSLDEDLRMHAAALGVGSSVTFIGEPEDEHEILRAADVGWVAAGGDAAAMACLDCMALRVPVIAERSPLTQHYVADGITGLLLAPSDPSRTASDVAECLAIADRRVAMGNAGRTRVQRDFPETAMIDGFERAVNAAGDRAKWKTA
ncbi:MAG TPA: glycosyltransferase [Casimicrobiaceae bacterium]|nr:glycosyltransferase [Casimicrobiaceae bacterium]